MSDIQEQTTPNERAKEISQAKTPENPDDIQKSKSEEPKYFYRLLLTQLTVILISTFLPTKRYFFYSYAHYPRSGITFDEYCSKYEKCRQSYYYYNSSYYYQDQNQYEVWKNSVAQDITVYSNLYYFSFFIYPALLVIQSVFRNCQLFKQRQKLFHYIQYPFLSLFIQVCTHQIKSSDYSNLFYHLRILLIYKIGIVGFFYFNQKCLQWQLETKSTTQRLVNGSFALICLKELLNCISQSHSSWIPHILFLLYTQVYLLHLNSNLFQENNKYAIQNRSVLQLTKQKIQSFFDVQDVYREVAQTYFVISKKIMYSSIGGIVLAIILRDQIFKLEKVLVLSGIFLILGWETSLVSTSSKLTNRDQYQAASLYFLDFMLPIRNIVMAFLA
ncbi:unnamed protein product (macronuclear) [Paramecium tetraurelia]|uniref:Transmembrane protein n=1 Tax=Paramecium tetraurelia TaxID=5888 RepID=A0E5B4_PARTE|nr:uncharacterized protein GSPATT00023658001 [Paramecium tetraurelia]CAK90481.1 unnamed protein product [Paramecium tetraurelia]|eukprot:XP_001457878.1 hypothetical protein (macronuclear) [Paramecium tetraurelia strain d4-2]